MFDKTTQQATNPEYLYLQQIQSVCFMQELSDNNKLTFKCIKGQLKETDVFKHTQGSSSPQPYRLLNYVLTDGAGGKKYLCSLSYFEVYVKQLSDGTTLKAVCPKAITLVSV